MESRISLSGFAGELVARLPQAPCRCRTDQGKEDHYTFSEKSMPAVPSSLVSSNLVVRKTEHHYGSASRVDVIHFYASGQTHRELAVLILAAVFSGKSQRVAIDLQHPASTVKRLEINYSGFSQGSCWDYTKKPAQFTYHPEIPQRIPWNWHLDEKDLPMFELDFSQDSGHHPVNDLDKRDKVEIGGGDDGLVLLADLLLNIGLPACDVSHSEGSLPPDKSYVLECFLGHQRVKKWSAEAQFHLPESFSSPGEHPALDK